MRSSMILWLQNEADNVPLDSPVGPSIWLNAYSDKSNRDLAVNLGVAYLTGKTSIDCLNLIQNEENSGQIAGLVDWFVSFMRSVPLSDWAERLMESEYAVQHTDVAVPQISNFDAERLDIVDILAAAQGALTYEKVGYHLLDGVSGRSSVAKRKYGENASQFAAILDMVRIGRGFDPSGRANMGVKLSVMGKALSRMIEGRGDVTARLMFKSVLFRNLVFADHPEYHKAFLEAVDLLSPVTRARRASAFTWMIDLYLSKGGALGNGRRTEELICHMRH